MVMLKPTVYMQRSTPRAFDRRVAPAAPMLELRPDGRLWLVRDEGAVPVTVRRCFPWSEPGRFVSLRDGNDREVALVRDPAELDWRSRRALETALAAAGFVLEVTRVHSVTEEIEIRHWVVETAQGARTFQTRLDDWPRELAGGGVLIRDVAGDLYHVPAPDRLDPASRELLWAFVD